VTRLMGRCWLLRDVTAMVARVANYSDKSELERKRRKWRWEEASSSADHALVYIRVNAPPRNLMHRPTYRLYYYI